MKQQFTSPLFPFLYNVAARLLVSLWYVGMFCIQHLLIRLVFQSRDKSHLSYVRIIFIIPTLGFAQRGEMVRSDFETTASVPVSLEPEQVYDSLLYYFIQQDMATQSVLKEVPIPLSHVRERQAKEMEVALLDQYSKALIHTGQADSAYYYLRQMLALQDEIQQTNPEKDFMRRHMNSIFEKEQAVIAAQLQRQHLMLRASGLGLLLLGGMAFVFYRNSRLKKRTAQSLKLVNDDLKKEQAKLKKINQKLQNFSGVVSHDILSNLEIMLATGNVLVGPNSNKEQLRSYFNATQTISSKMKKYCLELLETAYTDKPAAIVSAADSVKLTEELLLQYAPKFRELNFRLEMEPLPAIALPPVVLQQFLHNGITNALKYAPREGNPAPLLKIGGHVDPERKAYWYLEDDGPGIPDTKKEAILFGEKALESRQGQGVGLKKLRDQLALYGGQLTISASQWGGCKLIVSADDEDRSN